MAQFLTLLAFLSIVMHDLLGGPVLGEMVPAWAVAGLTLGAPAGLAAAVFAMGVRSTRRLDQGESWAVVGLMERLVAASRLAAGLWHLAATLLLGWPDVVRRAVGDWIAVDEVLAASPLVLFIVSGWVATAGLEHRLREAMALRRIERGEPAGRPPGPWAMIGLSARHHLPPVVVPIVLVMGWNELIDLGLARASSAGWGGAAGAEWLSVVAGLAQFGGMLAIILMAPLLLRRLWRTRELTGPMRDRLAALAARHRVRLGTPLVWLTHGSMVNGAVLGLFWPARYILLTDALLEHLTPEQVEAVSAHEVGHIRRGHMVWLGLCVLASLFASGLIAEVLASALRLPAAGWVTGAASALSLALAGGVFLWVSRRFEWQADAFAAQHLSRSEGEPAVVTERSAAVMASALQAVADLNGVSVRRPSLRHGSIALRQSKLRALVGRPLDGLPIDRQARWIKRGAGAMLALGVGAMFLPPW